MHKLERTYRRAASILKTCGGETIHLQGLVGSPWDAKLLGHSNELHVRKSAAESGTAPP